MKTQNNRGYFIKFFEIVERAQSVYRVNRKKGFVTSRLDSFSPKLEKQF